MLAEVPPGEQEKRLRSRTRHTSPRLAVSPAASVVFRRNVSEPRAAGALRRMSGPGKVARERLAGEGEAGLLRMCVASADTRGDGRRQLMTRGPKAAERAREHLVTGEPGGDGNREHPLLTRREPRSRALESEAQRVLLWRLADDATECAVKVKLWTTPNARPRPRATGCRPDGCASHRVAGEERGAAASSRDDRRVGI